MSSNTRSNPPWPFDWSYEEAFEIGCDIAFKVLGDWHEARDVVQDRLLEFVKTPNDQWRTRADFLRFVSCRAIDIIRARVRKRHCHQRAQDEHLLTHDSSPAAEAEIEKTEEASEVAVLTAKMLNSLSEHARAALELYAQGQSYEHIAKVMRTTKDSVHCLIHRSRKTLKDNFGKQLTAVGLSPLKLQQAQRKARSLRLSTQPAQLPKP
jgi:RNA polymerase sigma factor (sigma-70 family)